MLTTKTTNSLADPSLPAPTIAALRRAAALGVSAAMVTFGAGCYDEADPYENEGDGAIVQDDIGPDEEFIGEDEIDDEMVTADDEAEPVDALASDEEIERQLATRGGDTMRMSQTAWNIQQTQGEDGTSTVMSIPAPDGTDGLVVSRMQPSEVRVGEPMEYTIEVENVSSMSMYDVKLKEWRTGGLQIEDTASMGGETLNQPTNAEDTSTWTIDRLMPGQSETIQVTGVAEQEGQVGTCMTVEYDPALCIMTEVVKPELMVQRVLEKDQAYVCNDIEVVYMVRNAGSGTAEGVTIREDLPDGVMTADGSREVELTVNSIAAGETVERRVMLSADQPGEYASYAIAQSGDLQARTRETDYRFVRPELDLMLDAPSQEYVGRDVPIQITVENTSNWPAMETVLNIPQLNDLPQMSLSTQAAEVGDNRILLGELAAGESRTLNIMFAADNPTSHTINATANAFCAMAADDEIAIEVLGIEAVRLETIDLVDPVAVGEETVYEVQVKNQGTAASINVDVSAMLPEEMNFVSGTGDSNVTAQGQQVRFETIPELAPGDIASWRVRVMAQSPAKTRLRLELTSDATKRPVIEQEPTTIIDAANTQARGGN